MITLYKSDGTKEDHSEQKLTLKWMQEKVGGYIEMLHLTRNKSIICNEEGKLKGLPPAHAEIQRKFKACGRFSQLDFLVGDCLLISSPHKIP